MDIHEEAHLVQHLREEVERKFGRKVNYSKDCKLLSRDISEATNKQLSLSTIKRFFGMIHSPFNPSRYTLDALSGYLGFDNWHLYAEARNRAGKDAFDATSWEVLKKKVQLINKTSIHSLSGKCRYRQRRFIHRPFAEAFFNEFIQSDKTATALVAPAGYGKSAILLQWVQLHFSGNDQRFQDDIVCLIDGGIFNLLYNQDRDNEILNHLLDFDIKPIQDFFANLEQERGERRFIIIIDDVDKIFSSWNKYYALAENLMQLIMMNKTNGWFKLILTCRPGNMDPFTALMLQNPLLAETFYHINFRYKNHHDAINVPLFSQGEIKDALAKAHSNQSHCFLSLFYPGLLKVIDRPSFFSFFIQNEGALATSFSEIDFLNLLIQYVFYSHPYAEEKQGLIKKFLQLCNKDEDLPSAAKIRLLEEEHFRRAYEELIKSGLIYEYIEYVDPSDVHVKARFTNRIIFEYLMAKSLVKNKGAGSPLLDYLFEAYHHNIPLQYGLLQWHVKLAFFEENHELLKQVHGYMEQKVNIPNELAGESMPGSLRSIHHAFAECLRSHKSSCERLMPWFAASALGRKLYFEEYFDMDNLMFFPDKSLDAYSRYNQTADGKMAVRFIRFMKSFYSLDDQGCKTEFEAIKNIDFAALRNSYFVGYYFSAYFLYASLVKKNDRQEMLGKVIDYSANLKLNHSPSLRFIPPFEFFILYNLNTCDFYDEAAFFAEHVEKSNPTLKNKTSVFYHYFRLCHARSLLHTGESSRALELYNQVHTGEFPPHIRHFMQINLNMARVDFLDFNHQTSDALDLLHETSLLARQMGYTYFEQKAARLKHDLLRIRKNLPG